MKNLSRTGKFPNELQLSPFSQKRRFADDQVINQYLSQIDQIINASINNDNRALPVGVIEALDEKFILVQNKIDEVIENIELNGEVNYTMIVDRVNELNEFIDRYINNIKNDLFNLYDKESLKNYILTKAKNYFYNMKGDCIVSSADIIEDIYAIYINDTGIEGKITIYNDNRIFVEGYNTKGQLGAPYIGKNSTFYIDEPYEIFVPGLTKENIKKVVFAVDSTFILTNDKNLYVAGNNSKGELGLANYKTKTLPEPVNGFIKIEDDRLVNNIEEIQTSYIDDKTTIISTTNGKLYGTGSNESGVFGQGDNVGCNYFKEINFNVKKVRPQDELKLSNYALSPKGDLIISTEDYNLIACGRNNNGSLGINRDISINKFEVLNLKSNMYFTGKVRNFYFGGTDRSYVVTDDNNLWVCGNNEYGQLGVGDIIPRLIWTKIEVDGILNNVKDVHISGDSSFLITLDDCLWVCGRNQVGQLGIGSAISVINIWTKVTIPLLLNKIDKIYSRGSTPIIIFIVDKDGYLWRTGESTYGIAGDGTSNNYNIFTRSSFFGPVSGIYIDHLCFNVSSAYIITKDSNIYVTGRNSTGQLGLGNTANVLTWTKISIVGINNNVKTLYTSSNEFSFILTLNGDIYGCGRSTYGRLGLGVTTDVLKWTKITTSGIAGNVKEMSLLPYDSYLITKDNNLWVCGRNTYGNLGLGNTTQTNTWTKVDRNCTNNRTKKIFPCFVSPKIVCRLYIIDIDDNLYACGYNGNYVLGIQHDGDVLIPTLVDCPDLHGNTKSVNFNGTYDSTFFISNDNKLYGCGNNGSGRIGLPDYSIYQKFLNVPDIDDVKELYVNSHSSSSFNTHSIDNTVNNVKEVIATNYSSFHTQSIDNTDNNVKEVIATNYSSFHTQSIDNTVNNVKEVIATNDSSFRTHSVVITKNNVKEVIGTNDSSFNTYSIDITDNNVKEVIISNSNNGSCYLITNDNNLYVCGYNGNGQLGVGNTTNVRTWTKIDIEGINNNVKEVIANNNSSYLITNDNNLYVCGRNTQGELGVGNNINERTWTKINIKGINNNVKEVITNYDDSYLITNDNNLYVCGNNNYGQLGVGNTTNNVRTWTKINIEGINNNVKEVIINYLITNNIYSSSYLITLDNNLYVCGVNNYGQLGLGNTTDVYTWTKINIEGINNNVKEIINSDYYYSSYLITNDNNLYVCGRNDFGQLGVDYDITYVLTWTKIDIEGINNNVKEVISNNNIINRENLSSSYLITNDNNLYVCGYNGNGQLGVGNTTNVRTWTKIDIEGINNNVKEVITNSDYSSYIITLDNNLYVCGYNGNGQLGVGNTTNVRTWTKIDIEGINNNVKEVISNNNIINRENLSSSYLITNDNNLYVCGYNGNGQLGVGNTTNVRTWTKIDIEGINNNVKEVISNNNYSYLITLDNNLYVCGYNGNGQLGVGNTTNILTWTKVDVVTIVDIIEEVINNIHSSYLITNDNNLYVCGSNGYGQLGVGNTTNILTWTKITTVGIINNVKEVITNNGSSYLITNDNNLYVCGSNNSGQLGLGHTNSVLTWAKITLTGIINKVKEVIAIDGSSYLITNDNNLYVCGNNASGQLGVGNTTNILTWTKITTVGIIEVIINNGSSYLITLDNNLYVCGYNYYGQLGVDSFTNVLTWTKISIVGIIDNVKEVINNIYSSYLITNDNNLYVCGYNYYGQLGVGNTDNVLTWTKINIEGINNNVKEVITNIYSSYLITLDNNLYVCGRNDFGQLGVGNTDNVLTWTKINIEGINNNVKEVISNNNYSYLITLDNNLYVCGNNSNGQLGLGNTTDVKTWTKITLAGIIDNVKEVITNNGSSYLITNNNNLYVCGENNYGQLGVGNTTNVLTWAKITLTGIIDNVKEVIINNYSYLITNDNNLYVCGYNYYGQLGVGDTYIRELWTKIDIESIVDIVKEVNFNNASSYLITLDNNLYVCGNNRSGQLGLGNTTDVKTWTKITLAGIIDNVKEVITNNGSSYYLITLDNNLWVCGSNNYGQFGLGNTTNVKTWTKIDIIGIIDNVKEVITKYYYSSYIITLDNNLYVCGRNNYGQLGVGNTTDVLTWTKIDIMGINNNVKEVIINISSSYLITNNNNLYVCGYNYYGHLGVGGTTDVLTWIKIDGIGINNNVKEVITNNGSSYYLITLDNNLWVCGYNSNGQLGLGHTTNVNTWIKIDVIAGIIDNVKEVINNNDFSYLITLDNNLYVCGENNYGQLGVGSSTTNVLRWTKIYIVGINNNVKEVINNYYDSSYLITLDNNLWVCGYNSDGQLGLGYTITIRTWTKINTVGIVNNVKKVINNYSSYLITLDNNLYVCGENNYGQLGVGNTTNILSWTKIDIVGINNNVKEIIIDQYRSSCLITNDNNLYVCGYNNSSRLGVGNATDVYTWTKVDIVDTVDIVEEVITNNGSSYLITDDNNLYVCGRNNYGQLGRGNTTNISTWTKITLSGIINNIKEVIITNNNYSYLITNDNNLYVCGYNEYGQLGRGNTTNVLTWTKIDIEGINNNVKEVIITNNNYSYLITNDNNLYVCGYNEYGQLGRGNTTNVLTWTKITLTGIINNIKEVISDRYSSYLITKDNNLYVCGNNDYGQLGRGIDRVVNTWTKITLTGIINNVKEVISDRYSSYLITNDNNLYVCGNNEYGQLGVGNTTDVSTWTKITTVGIINNVKEVITNIYSSYLITLDNNLYVCGYNYFGQLGVGNTTIVLTWTKIISIGIINNVKEFIINNNGSSYLITKDNNLYVCGHNNNGQLGVGNTTNVLTWTKIDIVGIVDNVKEFITNNNSSYLITNDNNLYVCGYNEHGQLGVGNTIDVSTWTKITLTGVIDNVKEVNNITSSSYLITNDDNLYVCGRNNYGQLGRGNTTNILTWTKSDVVTIVDIIEEVITDNAFSYLITNDDNLYVCGRNNYGQLGLGNTTNILTWTRINIIGIIDNVKEVITNNNSSYLITNDDNLYVCGYNNYGQLGVGNTTNVLTWTKIDTVGIINNIKEVINNNNYSYLITNDNNLYVCGYNEYGQLGRGNTTNVLTWTKITSTGIINNVKEVIINIYSSYLITLDNNLYVCGYNEYGQLGRGNTTNVLTWTKITSTGIINNVKEVINNNGSSYLITLDNNLYVSGYNRQGQLGVGNIANISTWTKITSTGIINNVKEVIRNNNSSYLITLDNNLYVCGRNEYGQLGRGNTGNRVLTWTKITSTGIINNVKEVIRNNNSSYLITLDNNLYVCGGNNNGQLGVGNTTNVLTWTKITLTGIINNVKEVINIGGPSYLITLDNNLYVCGGNNNGQLGVGNTTNVLTWTKITLTGIINNVKEFITNNNYSYLITLDNNLYVCGYNYYGQLGLDNTTNRLTWTKADVVTIVDIIEEVINNNNSSYLITNDNNLYVCGHNNNGQLGVGDTTDVKTWAKIDTVGIIDNIKEVINDNGSSYLITLDNDLYVCGRNNYGQLGVGNTTNVLTWTKITLTGIINNVKEVIINSDYSSYLITLDNNLYVCGYNDNGQLGRGNTTNVLTWTKITLTGVIDNVKEVNININSSYLITNDNNLYVCGRNNFGQIGLGINRVVNTWTKIASTGIINNVKEVINIGGPSYLITLDNNLYVCGYNEYGQLGRGNNIDILTWTKIDIVGINNNVKEVINIGGPSYLITLDNNLYVCGRNNYGQLGVGNTTDVKTWTKITLTGIINNVKEVIRNNNSSYLITLDNNLYVCGNNYYGQLGRGNTTNVLTWTKITLTGIINNVKEVIANNNNYSYLITLDNNLYVCGYNEYGQLGRGNTTNVLTWTKITLSGVVVDNKWSYMKDILMRSDSLSGNTYKSIYYKNDTINHHFMNLSLDELITYPVNIEIGGLYNVKLDDLVMYPTNVEIEGLNNVKEVINNNNSSYLITKDNNLYVCGYNNNGQLGVGNTTNISTRTKADVVTIVDIIEEVINSDYSSYLITNDNNLYVCGGNNNGQLGLEDTIDRMKYELIESIKDNDNDFPIDINNNNEKYYILNNNLYNTTLLFVKNKIYYTGSDLLSENNNNFWKNLIIPEDESKSDICISNKETKSIYIFKDHGLYASGDNTYGKLGVGSNLDQVTGLSYLPIENFNPKKVYKAKNLLFVVSENGTLYAAGDNTYGQLGLDSSLARINSFMPSDIFNNTDNIIKDIYINEIDNYNTIFIITETNKIYMAGRLNSTQNIIKWTSKEKIIEDTFEIVDPNNKETKEINVIINESKTPILSFDSYDDSGVNQKNDFAFEIIIKSKNRYIKSLITCSNNDLNIYTDYSVGKDEIKLSFYKDENNKNILSVSSVDIPSNYTINIIPIILKNIILSDDISGTSTTLIKEFVIGSDIFGHIDPVDTNRVKIEYANLKKMKMINLSVDVDKLNTYIISNKEISEDILNTNIKSHIKEDDYYGPQFLYTLFSKYIPTNTFVKFIGSIRVNGKMYKTSYVKISNPIVDDKYGVIQFIFDKTQKFINNENKKSAYNNTGEYTDISKGLNFGITFYPLSIDGGNRYYVNSSNTFDFEDSLLNQKVSLNCIELNAISPGGKKVAIGNKNSCSITQNSVKLIDNISKRVIKTRSFNYYDNIIFDNCVSLSTNRFALGKDTKLYIVDSNDLFTINKITLTKNISKLFVNNDILIIKYTDNSVDIRQYKNNILLPVTTSNNTSDYIIKSTLNLSTLEFYDYNDFSEVNTSFAHYIDANAFVPYITNESFTDIVPNVSADSKIYLMEYRNKKLNTIHTGNHIKKIYKTIDNSIGAIMDINNNLFLYNANQKKYTQIESELILSDENIKEIFISTYKSQYDYLGLYLIDKDNNIWVCGYNNNDRLGIDGDSFVLTKIDDIGINNNVRSYEFTNSSMIIVTNDNNLWVCGSTGNNATGSNVTTLTKINNENIINNVDHIEILNKSEPYSYRIVVKTIDNKVLLSGTNYYMEFGKPSDEYGFTLIDGIYNTVTEFIEDPMVDIAMCNDILYMTTENNRLFQFSNENDKWMEILLNVNVSKMFIYELNSYVFILTTDNKLYSVFSKAYSIYEAGNIVLEEYDITEIINNNETIKDITENPDMYIKTENNIIYEFDHVLNKFILASDQINLVDIIPGILTYAVDEENNVYIRID